MPLKNKRLKVGRKARQVLSPTPKTHQIPHYEKKRKEKKRNEMKRNLIPQSLLLKTGGEGKRLPSWGTSAAEGGETLRLEKKQRFGSLANNHYLCFAKTGGTSGIKIKKMFCIPLGLHYLCGTDERISLIYPKITHHSFGHLQDHHRPC